MKRALNGKGTPLEAIVATEVEARHLERLAEMRGVAYARDAEGDVFRVTLG